MIAFYGRQQLALDPALEYEYFQFRHEVFCEQLGWRDEEPDGLEFDQFDDPASEPLYAIGQNSLGMVTASWRIIDIDRPHMLPTVFPQLLPGSDAPRCRRAWELSRFAVNGKAFQRQSLKAVNKETARLVATTISLGLEHGIEEVFVVAETRVLKVMHVLGCRPSWTGPTDILAGQPVQAAGYRLSLEFLNRVQVRGGLGASPLPAPAAPMPVAA